MMVPAGIPALKTDKRMAPALVYIPVAVGMKMFQIRHGMP